MLGLTPLGIIHTAISLIAVLAGLVALIRDKQIAVDNLVGRTYWVATVLTCLSSLGIFQHGGFGKPHALAIITLVVLGVAAAARWSRVFGRASVYVETVAYSLTFFFHLVPGLTEASTRLPPGAPLVSSPQAPELQLASAILFLLFLVGATLQVLRLACRERLRHSGLRNHNTRINV